MRFSYSRIQLDQTSRKAIWLLYFLIWCLPLKICEKQIAVGIHKMAKFFSTSSYFTFDFSTSLKIAQGIFYIDLSKADENCDWNFDGTEVNCQMSAARSTSISKYFFRIDFCATTEQNLIRLFLHLFCQIDWNYAHPFISQNAIKLTIFRNPWPKVNLDGNLTHCINDFEKSFGHVIYICMCFACAFTEQNWIKPMPIKESQTWKF